MPKEPRTLRSTGRLLSAEERGWTVALEGAIQSAGGDHEDLGRLTDFEIAAHAIVAKDDTDLALHRIRRMKKFKDSLGVGDDGGTTVFHAIQVLHRFFHAYPDFVHAFGTDLYGRHTVFFRLAALTSPPPFNHTEQDRMTALYYLFHAMQPDLDAVRRGTVWIGDLTDVTRQTLSLGLFAGGRALTKDSYPIKVKDFPCLSAPSRFSAVSAICWPFFSAKLAKKYVGVTPVQLKDHFPPELLSRELGGTMSPADVMERIEDSLKRRFDNEESFRL